MSIATGVILFAIDSSRPGALTLQTAALYKGRPTVAICPVPARHCGHGPGHADDAPEGLITRQIISGRGVEEAPLP